MQPASTTNRRLSPRIWHTDWLVLKGLTASLGAQMTGHLRSCLKLVDFGCGSMPYRELVIAHGANYCGADLDKGGDIQINSDGSLPLENSSADALLSVQVLEHVRVLDSYCAEIYRVLADDGMLLLSTHGIWLYHPHPEDHRRWTRTRLVVDLETQGFVVEDMVAIVGPLATTTLIRLTSFVDVLRRFPIFGEFAALMNVCTMIADAIISAEVSRDNCVYLVHARQVGCA